MTLMLLYKRESTHAFTEKLLIDGVNVTADKAKQIISQLLKLSLLGRTVAETDGGLVEFYSFYPRPSFVSMLIFAREMIDIPDNFYVNNRSRRKPFLK